MHVQVRINSKVKMKSTNTQCYVAEKKFRERYPKIQLRSSSQRSTQLPFESGTKVHSGSLCTCGNRDNFRITESISKILGPERSP